ncbi:MAG: heme biosynthesis protein HemY, partial [Pseudomonadota bacterium]
DKPELANILAAQAARAAGQEEKAERYYKALARRPKTQSLGVRGLLEQAAERGDKERARKLAERAFALRPRDGEIMARLFDLQTDSGDWAAARRTLAAEVRSGELPREVGARRDAVLALAESRAAMEAGDPARAREAALEAHRRSPALVPAAVAAARQLGEDGQVGKAERALRQTWKQSPHPDVAAAYAALIPDESPEERRRRFQSLISENRDHPESRLLEAELALAAEDFPGARKALGDLYETRPTTRSLAIMAAVERGSGAEDHVVRAFLARALSAPRGERWTCEVCGHVHEEWTPVCDSCKAVDSLAWKQPEGAGESSAAEQALLPVIMASLAGETEQTAEADEPSEAGPAEPREEPGARAAS